MSTRAPPCILGHVAKLCLCLPFLLYVHKHYPQPTVTGSRTQSEFSKRKFSLVWGLGLETHNHVVLDHRVQKDLEPSSSSYIQGQDLHCWMTQAASLA